MARRLGHLSLRVSACVAVAAACAIAGPPVDAAPQRRGAAGAQVTVKDAEKAIDKAAAERQIHLSEAAKNVLAVEVVRQGTAKGTDAPAAATPDAKIQEVLTSVTDHAPAGEITADQAAVMVAKSKELQITPDIRKQIDAHTAASGKTLSEEALTLAVTDLAAQTKALASSGLSVETIKERNEAYLSAVNTLLAPGATVTAATYQEARRALFTRFVNLTIETVPPGATVKMEGKDIGVTSIASRAVEPGKLYRFEFTLPGYYSPPREFYVSPAPPTQTVSEVLAAGAQDAAVAVEQDGRRERRDHRLAFVAVAGVGVVIGLVLLMRLKS